MTPLRRCSLLFVLLLALVVPTRAAEPLEQVPDDAVVVLRFASADKYLGNFKDLLSGIGPLAVTEAGPEFEDGFGDLIDVNEEHLDVLNREAPIYMAVFPIFDGPEPLARFVQVKDDARFRRVLLRVGDDVAVKTEPAEGGFEKIFVDESRSYFVAKRGDTTVFTNNPEVLKKLAAHSDASKSLAAALDPRAKELLESGDVSVAVHIAVLTEKFRGEIESAKDEALREIDAIEGDAIGTGDPEGTKKMLKGIVEFGFETAFDVTWFAGHAKFSAEGAQGEGLVLVKEGSASDTRLAAAPPDTLELLGLLPKGYPAYFGVHLPPEFSRAFSDSWLQVGYGAAAKDEGLKKEGLQLLKEAELTTIVSGIALPKDDKTGMVTTTIEAAGDVNKLKQGWRKYVQSLDEIKTDVINQKLTYKENDGKHKEHDIDLLITEFSAGEGEVAVILKSFFEVLFGGLNYEARIATVGELLLQVGGNDPKLIADLIDSLDSGEGVVALEDAYGATRDKLGEKANALVMVDVARLIVDGANMIKRVPLIGEALAAAPFNFALDPPASYGGFSAATEKQGLRVRAFVPVQQPKGIIQLFAPGI
jgi:hypothetical protein